MMKIQAETIQVWARKASDFLSANNLTLADIVLGRDAWTVAHRCEITAEAYKDRDICDAHIQTALQRIFPNVVFKDAKRY